MAEIIVGEHTQKQVEPVSQKSTYTTFNELFVLLDPAYYADEELNQNVSLPARLSNFVSTVNSGCDPIFDSEDMLPFFMIHFF